jgi:hypothetical protein
MILPDTIKTASDNSGFSMYFHGIKQAGDILLQLTCG